MAIYSKHINDTLKYLIQIFKWAAASDSLAEAKESQKFTYHERYKVQ